MSVVRHWFGPDVEWVDEPDYDVDPARGEEFYGLVRRYWPGLPDGALQPSYAGVRPKIVPPGNQLQDFRIDGPASAWRGGPDQPVWHGKPGFNVLSGNWPVCYENDQSPLVMPVVCAWNQRDKFLGPTRCVPLRRMPVAFHTIATESTLSNPITFSDANSAEGVFNEEISDNGTCSSSPGFDQLFCSSSADQGTGCCLFPGMANAIPVCAGSENL